MDKTFLKYMKSSTPSKKKAPNEKELLKFSPGPIITISREYGCHGCSIGYELVDAINRRLVNMKKNVDPWKFVSKQIIEESAKELNMSPDLLSDLSLKQRNNIFSDLTSLFSNSYYASGTKIKNTIAKIISTYAREGSVVITGRAAEAITKDIKRAIHIKLVAPLDVRAQWVADEEDISLEEAKKRCIEEDKKRCKFRKYFEGKNNDLEYFDTIINLSKTTNEEAIEMVMILAEARGFF